MGHTGSSPQTITENPHSILGHNANEKIRLSLSGFAITVQLPLEKYKDTITARGAAP